MEHDPSHGSITCYDSLSGQAESLPFERAELDIQYQSITVDFMHQVPQAHVSYDVPETHESMIIY